jgi:hypothetical protein
MSNDFIFPEKQPSPWENAGKWDWSGTSVDSRRYGINPSATPTALGIPVNTSPPLSVGIRKTNYSPYSFGRSNPFDAATMGTGHILSSLNFDNVKDATTKDILNRAMDKVRAAQDPVGYASFGGKRVNYGDIGTKSDPYARRGGYVMSTGNPLSLPDSNMGLAVRDAQERQHALDLSGVGAGGTQPLSLAQRLNQPGASGWGSLISAQLAGKSAKDDWNRFASNRDNTLRQDLLGLQRFKTFSDVDTARGVLDLQRRTLPLDLERMGAGIARNNAETAKLNQETAMLSSKKPEWDAANKIRSEAYTRGYTEWLKENPGDMEGATAAGYNSAQGVLNLLGGKQWQPGTPAKEGTWPFSKGTPATPGQWVNAPPVEGARWSQKYGGWYVQQPDGKYARFEP